REGLDEKENSRFEEIVTFTTNLEHVGDIIVRNLMELAAKKIRNRLAFSDAGLQDIHSLHERLANNLQLALGVFLSRDVKAARRLIAEKDEFRYLERAAVQSHLARLRSGRIESIETSALHLDVLRDLKRIHAHVASAAHPILEAAGELNRSRLKPAEPIPGAE
ncbi:PhoU domain-containing protein, partial [Arenibaculum sp.]|uniref:PhoU domain-containing protein n=1 Tax=Arenibaculum sp. TaxID=2865862 RepID=UPI002E10B37E|nr:PhoU domain-containing protein [Arenibaculum sp.]